MASFATPTELQTHLGLAAITTARAQTFLDQATEKIRTHCGQVLSLVNDESITLDGNGSGVIWVPELPIVAIDSVTVDGLAVAASKYRVYARRGMLKRTDGGTWGTTAVTSTVVIVYDHGHATIPDDLKGICLAAAGRAYTFRDPSDDFGADVHDGAIEAKGYPADVYLLASERRTLDEKYRPILVG